jgi:hypothetical protein
MTTLTELKGRVWVNCVGFPNDKNQLRGLQNSLKRAELVAGAAKKRK